jgi:cytochrome P450
MTVPLNIPLPSPQAGAGRPYPPGPPFLSRILKGQAFRQNAADFLASSARQYGDLTHYRALGHHIYQLNHPSLIEDFFLKDHHHHHRNLVMQRARAVLGHGLLTSEEPLHMRQRRLAQPAFHRDRIAAYGEVIGAQATAMTARWQHGSARDVHAEMLAIALRIVAKCLFDLNVESDAEIRKVSSAVDAFMGFLPLAWLPYPELIQRLPLPAMQRIRRGRAELDAMIFGLIRQRRAEPAGAPDRGDLLSMLMAATDAEDPTARMSDTQLRDECLTILLAGHETTANGLSFALWLLARHPEIQSAVSREAREVLGTRPPAASDYPRLRYTTQVFSEALRLYPPVWVTARTCATPYSIAGYPIPSGAILLAPQFVLHRDPRFFPDPLRFDPGRFSDAGKASRPKFAFFPFAAGGRQCIGEGLAWMEGVFVLATILRDWHLSLPSGSAGEIAFHPAISLRPQSAVTLELERRS